MIDNYLLEYLVAFYQEGTIEKTAHCLDVTAPTISRGLKKLEKALQVKLFDRRPQRIILNQNGRFAAKRAQTILQQQQTFTKVVRNYAKQNADSLNIAARIPGPLLLLQTITPRSASLNIQMKTIDADNVDMLLKNRQASLIFNVHKSDDLSIASKLIGYEKLAIKITKFNPLFKKNSVTFKQLNGHEFVISPQLGEWQQIIEQNIPNGYFWYQNSQDALEELIVHSNFPIFKTNISNYLDQFNHREDPKRKLIPIIDKKASLPIYATYLKNNEAQVTPVISKMINALKEIKI